MSQLQNATTLIPAELKLTPEVLNPEPMSSALAFAVTPAKAGAQRF